MFLAQIRNSLGRCHECQFLAALVDQPDTLVGGLTPHAHGNVIASFAVLKRRVNGHDDALELFRQVGAPVMLHIRAREDSPHVGKGRLLIHRRPPH